MKFVGIDANAREVNLVAIDLESYEVKWNKLLGGPKAWDTARGITSVAPHHSWWEDVALVAIERPIGARSNVIWAQALVIGALIAIIPNHVVVQDFQATVWKNLVGLPHKAGKDEVMVWAAQYGAESDWDEHACDALAICHAALNYNNTGTPMTEDD